MTSDLDIARAMCKAGVTVFRAPLSETGDPLKKGWPDLKPDHRRIDAWKPGEGLLALTGIAFDVIDYDPRKFRPDLGQPPALAEAIRGCILGIAATAQGGWHAYVPPLGLDTSVGFLPGVDLLSRNRPMCVFIPPTSDRPTKPGPYKWIMPLDLERRNEHRFLMASVELASVITSLKAGTNGRSGSGSYGDPDIDGLVAGGVPAGQFQDDTLRDVTWKLVLRGMGDGTIWLVWSAIVAKTVLTDPSRPWTRADFDRHLDGARKKLGQPPGLTEAQAEWTAAQSAAPERGHDVPISEDGELAKIAALYHPVDWDDAFAAQPEDVLWLYAPWLERGTLNALFARPGTGKSLLALDVAFQIVREKSAVLYIDKENRQQDLVERLLDMGADPGMLKERFCAYSFPQLPDLDTPKGGRHLLALALWHQADLIVLDTTTRLVGGGENDADTFNNVYRHSLEPLKARGFTVLRLDHPGKDESLGQRGTSAKDGDVDNVWHMQEKARKLMFTLHRTKSRTNHGEDDFTLYRRSDPWLRHEWVMPVLTVHDDDEISKITGQLDDLNVPFDAGRTTVRKLLSDKGIKCGNDVLAKAIKKRRAVRGQPADSADSR